MRKILSKLRKDDQGIAAVEFGLTASAFLVLLMGGFDLGHTLYTQAVLQGTVQKAARDSSLETGTASAQQTTIDTKVRNAVLDLNKTATVNISREYYHDFTAAQAKTPEDANQNGICETGEVWYDNNRSNSYDADGGASGQGGAKDVVVYTVTMSYPRLFPVATLIGLSPDVNLTATTVFANQPYGEQDSSALAPRNCP